MALLAGMEIIFRVDESRIGLLRRGDGLMQQMMDVDDLPARGALRDEPRTVGFHHAVVVDRILRTVIRRIQRRRDHDDLRAGADAGEAELDDALLEGELTGAVERLVDAVVDAVASDDERRLEFGEHATETLMQIRTRERAAGMTGFGQAGSRLARESHVHDRRAGHALLRADRRLDVDRPVAAVSDAVAEEEDARFKFVGRSAGGEQDQEDEQKAWHTPHTGRRPKKGKADLGTSY